MSDSRLILLSLSPSHRVFSTHIRTLCKLHPSLIVNQSRELLDFAGSTANIYSKEELYTNVVSSVGGTEHQHRPSAASNGRVVTKVWVVVS